MGSAKKLVDEHGNSAHGSDEVSPYFKEKNQNKPYYEPYYYTQYGGKFNKRTNRQTSKNRDGGGSVVSSMTGKFEG